MKTNKVTKQREPQSGASVRYNGQIRRWVAMHTAWINRAEYDAGWRFVRDRKSISVFIKVQGIENAKWLARQLNKAEEANS